MLSLWVAYLPQRSSSVALRELFLFAHVGSQRHTLLSLVGEAHLRHERQARSDVLSLFSIYLWGHERGALQEGLHLLHCHLLIAEAQMQASALSEELDSGAAPVRRVLVTRNSCISSHTPQATDSRQQQAPALNPTKLGGNAKGARVRELSSIPHNVAFVSRISGIAWLEASAKAVAIGIPARSAQAREAST